MQVAEIIMFPKSDKNSTEINSYSFISLLPILSKVLEKLILKELEHILTGKAHTQTSVRIPK